MGPCQWSVALRRRQLSIYVESDSEVIPIFLFAMFRYARYLNGKSNGDIQQICQTRLGMFLLRISLTCSYLVSVVIHFHPRTFTSKKILNTSLTNSG